MKNIYLTLLLLGFFIAQEVSNQIEEGTVVEIDDGDDNELTRKYSYDFSHLCPTQPSPAVKTCQEYHNVARYVSYMLVKDELTEEQLSLLFQLQNCQENNVPSNVASIQIFCYLDGLLASSETILINNAKDYPELVQLFRERIQERIDKATDDATKQSLMKSLEFINNGGLGGVYTEGEAGTEIINQ